MAVRWLARFVGGGLLDLCRDVGGMTILLGRVIRALIPPTLDTSELLRNLHKMGNRSVPIVVLTGLFTGGIMVIQSQMFVRQWGATSLVGWGAGYAVFREIGPILIGLMFSGRVGANNTAELGTMTVTEQLDGLRALAIDPIRFLIVPRVLAMVFTLFCLTVIGDLVAILGAVAVARAMLDISPWTFYWSMIEHLHPGDVINGLIKATVFGFSIALTSCYFGISVRGGAVGVGRAVNNAVVAAAVSIFLLDFFLTYSLR